MPRENPTIDCTVDIDFLTTTDGRMSVRETLMQAHKPGFHIARTIPAYFYTAQIRLLTAILAVALRYGDLSNRRIAAKLRTTGLPAEAIDEALEKLRPATYLHHEKFPFMQRPAVNTTNPKEKASFVGPGEQPVKKLSPSMPPDNAEDFWNLLKAPSERLRLEDAVLQLVVYHHMSLAGNNAYCGDKCVSGSPAMRFVGAENSATEILWHGENLLETLLCMIPVSWVEGSGLPAWADRACSQSRGEHGSPHALWSATWTSNSPATAWDGSELVGVRTGGIPSEWYLPEMRDNAKDWWTARNEADPFYLYSDNGKELKLQRLDLGKDATALATNWAAENKTAIYKDWCAPRMVPPSEHMQLLFARHRMEGTASSPNIRASEIFLPSFENWAHDTDIDVQLRISSGASQIEKLHRAVIAPFRRENSSERKGGRVPLVLDFLHDSRGSASDAFWRHMSHVFSLLLKECRESGAQFIPSSELRSGMIKGSVDAFDEITTPYFGQEPARISHVRAGLERQVHKIARDFASPQYDQ
ncbi:MAG: type I-E CRISPR-associated protein Cse1/CasA [Corynebacterium sp.]|nr:type I-E CRISPR-associated protein Cse1/CasA [Corynebacterium sp.]